MPNEPVSAEGDDTDAAALNEITKRCFRALDEIAVLRRLVLSMALNIDADFMPFDERQKLLEIMGDN